MDLIFLQTVSDFYFHLKHYSILRALKRDLKLDILITVSRNTFLFAQRGGNSNCKVIYACKHFSIKMRDESKRDFKGHTLKKINKKLLSWKKEKFPSVEREVLFGS